MPKPSSPLLLDEMVDWCCSHPFSYYINVFSEASHPTRGDISLLWFCQGPGLTLVSQGGRENDSKSCFFHVLAGDCVFSLGHQISSTCQT